MIGLLCSLKFTLRNVIHWQVIHISLEKLKRVILNNSDRFRVQLFSELRHLVARNAFAIF